MSIPYIPFYVGDYDSHTMHLTLAEDGLYVRLLRLCWRTEGCSIPCDIEWIVRHLRISDDEHKNILIPILEEFFVLKKNRYSNPRLTKEWTRIIETSKKKSENGKKGGRPKKSPDFKQASNEHEEKHTLITPDPGQKSDDCKIAVDEWNILAEEMFLPKVQKLTKERRSKLLSRLKDCDGIDGWCDALEKIRGSSFLRGKNNSGWKADFDFLLRQSSFVKLMEGSYDDNSASSGQAMSKKDDYNQHVLKEARELIEEFNEEDRQRAKRSSLDEQ